MADLVAITQGWTEPILHRLLNDGSAVPIFGKTVTLILQDKDGTAIDTTGKVSIVDDGITAALKGKVQYEPDSADFTAARSPYYWKWQVDAGGEISFFPSDAALKQRVYRQGK